MSVDPVTALPDATPLDWGFTHEADLVTRSLRLTFAGSDPQKFGVPELTSAIVELSSVETGRYTLGSASLQDAATVVTVLRQDMPTGWYDVTLTLVDNLTGLRRTATELGLVFGDVTQAVLAVEPAGRAFRFGDPLTLRLLEPVGRTLAQIGVTPARLQPRLRRAEDPNFGAVVDSATVSAVRDRTLELVLNPRYADYSSTDPLHALDPGFASVVPLSIPVADLPSFQLLPIQLTTAVLGRVLKGLVRAVPTATTVLPGSPATWHLSNVSLDRLSNPGLDPIVFTEVQRLLAGSNIKVAVTGSLEISVRADHTGYAGPRARSTSTASPSLHPLAFTHVADFGVLRPPVIHHGSNAPAVGVDGAAVSLTAQLSATVNEPHIYTGTVTTPLVPRI